MTRSEQFRHRYGPWAVVTGASSGIGRELARELSAAGLNLVLVARSADALADLAAELAGIHGTEAWVVPLDLSRPEAADELDAKTRGLAVGLFVAAAGFGTSGPFLDNELTDELDMLAVNCRALVAQCWLFGRRFRDVGRGGIVLMSSLVGFQGAPRAAHYAATKAFVQTLAEGLAVELAPAGVTVLASAPGPTASGFADRAGMKMGATVSARTVARQTLAALGRRTTVRPGLLTKFLTYSLATLPRWARVRVMGRVMHGMTKHREN